MVIVVALWLMKILGLLVAAQMIAASTTIIKDPVLLALGVALYYLVMSVKFTVSR